ncbi:MAG: hypothetical protein WAN10_00690 [Candidatus Acidiferrales bacterium]
MFDWFSRYSQRQRDLAAGVDADLVASNWRKTKLWLSLFLGGILLLWIAGTAEVHGVVKEISRWLGSAMTLVGFAIAIWAQQERAFLHKPDPKKPPSLFK